MYFFLPGAGFIVCAANAFTLWLIAGAKNDRGIHNNRGNKFKGTLREMREICD